MCPHTHCQKCSFCQTFSISVPQEEAEVQSRKEEEACLAFFKAAQSDYLEVDNSPSGCCPPPAPIGCSRGQQQRKVFESVAAGPRHPQ